VAEGIEDERDLEVVLASGIGILQGFLLCRPCSSRQLRKLDFMKRLWSEPLPEGYGDDLPEDKSSTQEIRVLR
jgi:EAL domain-containing protein (putative c-di-GMP-specific phosphodiesterase class I)